MGEWSPHKHKSLEGLLKGLYVAITRAKSRLLICEKKPRDAASAASTAVFEWLQRQGLADMAAPDDVLDFARASSHEEWRRHARKFEKQRSFAIACV